MADLASTQQEMQVTQARVAFGINPLLILALLGSAFFIIYMVGIEPMPLIHDAFHDLRHGTGFPCH